MKDLSKREVASVLAALRLAQSAFPLFLKFSHHDEVDLSLSSAEIDVLCEQLNIHDAFDDTNEADEAYRLHFFQSHLAALNYIKSELVATLDDDFEKMCSIEREYHSDDDRDEMRRRIMDVRMLSTRLVISNTTNLENYKTLVVSTAHLPLDTNLLEQAADDPNEWMVMKREPGFFIKLYGDLNVDIPSLCCPQIADIVTFAIQQGFGMIEFDADGPVLNPFTVY